MKSYHLADGTFKNNAIQVPFGDDAVYDLFGLYLQDTILLNDHLELTGGGRLTRAAADIGKVIGDRIEPGAEFGLSQLDACDLAIAAV